MKARFNLAFAAFLIWGLSLPASAADISQVKNNRALVNLQGEPAGPGTEFFAIDSGGKKRALIRIRQVRGDKAIADVVKGQARPGMALIPGPSGASSGSGRVQNVPDSSQETSSRPRGFLGKLLRRNSGLGFVAGISQNTMSLTAKKSGASDELSMTGNTFNLMGIYDYPASPTFTIRGAVGMETFGAKSTTTLPAVCNDTTNCEVGFNYLAFEGFGQFNFMTGKTRAFVEAGLAFLMAMGKTSTISNLDTSSSTNQMLIFGVGADIGMGKGAYIPLVVEYATFPGSSSVKASAMIFRAGYGWKF